MKKNTKIIFAILLICVTAFAANIYYNPVVMKSTLEVDSLTANRALTSNGSNILTSSAVTSTELGYLSGVTSSIQTQFLGKVSRSGDTMTGNLNMSGNSLTSVGDIGAVSMSLSGLTASRALQTDSSKNLQSSSVTTSELGFLSGVTSSVQTQISSKVNKSGDTMTGNLVMSGNSITSVGNLSAVSGTFSGLTASRAVQTDGSKNLESSSVTTTELSYLSGTTMSVQNQLNGKQYTLFIGDGITQSGNTISVNIDTISPLSNKGELLTHNGSTNTSQAAGVDTQILYANSAETTGLEWAYLFDFAVPVPPIYTAGNTVSMTQSDTLTDGYLSSTDWNTFNNKQHTISVVAPILFSGNTLSIPYAGSTQSGLLSSADWNTFNNKQAAGNYITALTGDVIATGPGSVAGTLSNNSVINAKVSASAAIDFSKLAALNSANILVGNGSNVATSVAMSGDISLANTGATAYAGTVPLNKGGTGQTTKAAAFDALSPMSALGDIIYGGTSGTGTRLAAGSDGQVLTLASGIPAWAASGSSSAGMIINAYKAGTSGCTWSRSNSALGAFSTTAACPAITVVSSAQCTVTTTDDDLPQLVLTSCPVGKFKVTAIFSGTYSGGAQNIAYALSDGTTTVSQILQVMDGTVTPAPTLTGIFEYGSTGSHTFAVYGATSGTSVKIENENTTQERLTFIVDYTP